MRRAPRFWVRSALVVGIGIAVALWWLASQPAEHVGETAAEPRDGASGAPETFGPPIDVAGQFALAAETDPPALAGWDWGVVPVGVGVDAGGTVHWAQYRTNSIESLAAGSRQPKTFGHVDGPLGVAVAGDGATLYFTSDRHYPRSVGQLRAGATAHPLVWGEAIHRPFAIAGGRDALYWTENINGRIRTMRYADVAPRDLFDDGIANVGEEAGVVAVHSLGLTVDDARDFLFWSDVRTSTIRRSRRDGTGVSTILGPEDGLRLPTALALDTDTGDLCWADPGTASIRCSDAAGESVRVVADAGDGVLEPYGLAFDARHRGLVWSDVGRNRIARSDLAGATVEVLRDLPSVPEGATRPSEITARWVAALRTCAVAVGATKAILRQPRDMEAAARVCLPMLRAVLDSAPIPEASGSSIAFEVAARDLTWAVRAMGELQPFVDALPATERGRLQPILDGIAARRAQLDGAPKLRHDGVAASGQTTRYAATTRAGIDTQIPDDGSQRAGHPLVWIDHGDGTLSDPRSGRMWEKKCSGCGGLHDVTARLRRHAGDGEMEVSDWLAAINAEGGTGYAGHDDWRLPEVGELLDLVDYETFNPAVGAPWTTPACVSNCGDPTSPACSCTAAGDYWSAASPRDGEHFPVVAFHLGLVWGQPADRPLFVRAVRGPRGPQADRLVDNGDGTITDRHTGLMWEVKRHGDGGLHDVQRRLPWSFDGRQETIWDWLAEVNREGGSGFAGHGDWRIPSIKELYSLHDAGIVGWGVAAATVHWSATTFADFPALALSVGFGPPGPLERPAPDWVHRITGGVEPHPKTSRLAVRAVRGPQPPTPTTDAPEKPRQ